MFISVKEAADLTGKSSTTIYRLCNKRINTLYVRKEENKFLIDKDFLLATYPPGSNANDENIEEELIETTNNSLDNIPEVEKDIDNKEEPFIVLEKNAGINNEPIENADPDTHEIKKGTTLEFENKPPKTFIQNLISWYVLIGVSASLLIIAIFIYIIAFFV